MVLSLAPSVFAAEEPKITVAVDKTSVKAGETVTFTYESTAAVAEMTNLDVCLAYDGDVFEYVSVDTENSVWFENPRVRSRYTLLTELYRIGQTTRRSIGSRILPAL